MHPCPKVIYCCIYVLPLYLTAATRPLLGRSRDAPEAIRPRILSVSISTAACSIVTWIVLSRRPDSSPWRAMGYWPLGLTESATVLFLTALLFAAPLYEALFIDGAWRRWLQLEPVRQVWTDWPTWRNLVAVSFDRSSSSKHLGLSISLSC